MGRVRALGDATRLGMIPERGPGDAAEREQRGEIEKCGRVRDRGWLGVYYAPELKRRHEK